VPSAAPRRLGTYFSNATRYPPFDSDAIVGWDAFDASVAAYVQCTRSEEVPTRT
jgi:hypothetical protein